VVLSREKAGGYERGNLLIKGFTAELIGRLFALFAGEFKAGKEFKV